MRACRTRFGRRWFRRGGVGVGRPAAVRLGRQRGAVAHAEVRPRVIQAQPRGELGAGHERAPARAEHVGGEDARGEAAPGNFDAEETAAHHPAEACGGGGEAQRQRPAVQGPAVIGVCHATQPRRRQRARERVLHVFSAPTRAGEEVADHGLAGIRDHLARRGRYRGVRLRRLRRHALVHLRARVGVDIEARPARMGRERVRAARHRLGLERGQRPARRHLGTDHAAYVCLERHAAHTPAHEHAHDGARQCLSERGAAEVVGEDRAIGEAASRVAERALLTHAHAVAPARAADDELAGARGGGEREGGSGDRQGEQTADCAVIG